MSSIDDATDLIRDSKSKFNLIRTGCTRSLEVRTIEKQLTIDIKHCLENLRSALDYTARDLFVRFVSSSKANPKLYFPYTSKHKDFKKRIDECIPGLSSARPDLVQMLETFQDFHSGRSWMLRFMELTNKSKHVELSPQTRVQQKGIKISSGEHGLITSKLIVHPGGRAVIGGKDIPAGEYGPDSLPDVGPDATAEVTTWESLHFTINDCEVISFINESIDLVSAIVENIAAVK
jgi:hypothetical protein